MAQTSTHIQRAIDQIQEKASTSETDFTQHVLEDGNTISTQERVVKDVRCFPLFSRADTGAYQLYQYINLTIWCTS